MKYIILRRQYEGYDKVWPVVFSDRQTHAIVAKHMIKALNEEGVKQVEVVSGGECYPINGDFECEYGSVSLGFSREGLRVTVNHANARDEAVINAPDVLQGITSWEDLRK